jgi:hypothetical protein
MAAPNACPPNKANPAERPSLHGSGRKVEKRMLTGPFGPMTMARKMEAFSLARDVCGGQPLGHLGARKHNLQANSFILSEG